MNNSKITNKKKIEYGILILVVLVIMGLIFAIAKKSNNETPEVEVVNTEASEEVIIDAISNEIAEASTSETSLENEAVNEASTEATVETKEVEEDTEEVISAGYEPIVEEVEVIEASTETTSIQTSNDSSMVSGVDYSEWTKKQTYTASNGVTIKIKDSASPEWAGNGASGDIIYDGDLRPDSAYMKAVDEYLGAMELQLSVSDLPNLPASSIKRTSFPKDDPAFVDYMNKSEALLKQQSVDSSICYGFDASGVSIVSMMGGKPWELRYNGSSWQVTIYGNMSEVCWNGLKTCIKLVSPDGEQLFNEFYTQCYQDNPTFPDYDMWVNIGSSQAMASGDSDLGLVYFYFK